VLDESALPVSWRAADAHARQWQRVFLWLQALQLGALVIVALGSATDVEIGSFALSRWFMVVGVVTALVARLTISQLGPERQWYDGRAAAESVKSLAWRFATGGHPFPHEMPAEQATRMFVGRIDAVVETLSGLEHPALTDDRQVTEEMLTLRARPLAERTAAYLTGRIRDQRSWYAQRSLLNRKRANRGAALVVALESATVVLAIIRLTGVSDLDLSGIVATLTATVIAWTQTRQFESLSRAYAVTSHELSSVDAVLTTVADETGWAQSVEQAEEAISREHTLWQASHR
jgi:hypothetical protein